jgi:hypothetical protein
LLLASDLYASPNPQRIAFALAEGPKYASGPPAKLAFGQGRALGAPVDTVLHARGLPKGRGIYTADVTLPQSGPWVGVVQVKQNGRQRNASLAFQVQDQPQAPVAGTPAPRTASATVANPLGIDPICTRNPPCPLHEVSLSDVIGAGKPVAALFATPALCQSRTCGPVVDIAEQVRAQNGKGVTFIQQEIYQDNDPGKPVRPQVARWRLPTEPWAFVVDRHGRIASRFEGVFSVGELARAVQLVK